MLKVFMKHTKLYYY